MIKKNYIEVNVQNKEVITNTIKTPVEKRYVKVERDKDLKNVKVMICEVINKGKEIHETLFDYSGADYINRYDIIVEFDNYDLTDFKTTELYQIPNTYEYYENEKQYMKFSKQYGGGCYIIFESRTDNDDYTFITSCGIDWSNKEPDVPICRHWLKYNEDGKLLRMDDDVNCYINREYDENGNLLKEDRHITWGDDV